MGRAILCLVVDRSCCARPLGEAIEAATAAGVDWVQVRERSLETRPLLALVDEVREAAERGAGQRPVRLIINRRIDVALASGDGGVHPGSACGVHLGFDGVGVAAARRLLGDDAWIGVSTHSVEEVRAAAAAGASYAHLAPIHPPISKRASRPPLGLDAVNEAAASGLPILAQGGVGMRHCGALIRAGASGVAVTGAILMSEEPGKATAKLRRELDRESA